MCVLDQAIRPDQVFKTEKQVWNQACFFCVCYILNDVVFKRSFRNQIKNLNICVIHSIFYFLNLLEKS
ncbi:MAG: hypothetical protein DWQ10_11375 [Calditrichaeota bacterium]|nr:MAG: hypothetical protein DWQ10_11375 [Calditrichota bacterium]